MSQRCQVARQVFRLRHTCTLQQDWNDPDVVLQGGDDFKSNRIVLIGEAPVPIIVCRSYPTGPNEREQYVGLLNYVFNGENEVFAGRKTVNIATDLVAT